MYSYFKGCHFQVELTMRFLRRFIIKLTFTCTYQKSTAHDELTLEHNTPYPSIRDSSPCGRCELPPCWLLLRIPLRLVQKFLAGGNKCLCNLVTLFRILLQIFNQPVVLFRIEFYTFTQFGLQAYRLIRRLIMTTLPEDWKL